MNLVVVGTNHKYSPIEIRERITFSKNRLKEALIALSDYRRIKAAVILSTCNRTELYVHAQDPEKAAAILKGFLAGYHEVALPEIGPYLYTYIDKEAIAHLFSVTCGLDSQIIGEAQISEQVKFAYEQAKETRLTDGLLERVFDEAIQVSFKIREETKISAGISSLAGVVLDLVREEIASIQGKNIFIIGTGKISGLVAKGLIEKGASLSFVANRSYDKALYLARQLQAGVFRFDRLPEKLKEADIIISATSSPHMVLKKEELLNSKRPLLIIDLALPRDIDPKARELEGVSLFDLDDLDCFIGEDIEAKKSQLSQAEELIRIEVGNLCLRERLELAPEEALLP